MNRVLYLFGIVLAALAAAMVLTALFAQVQGDTALTPIFMLSAALTGFFGGACIFGLRGEESRLTRMEALWLATMLWAVTPAFIALPFYTSGVLPTGGQALYESYSAFTTTGSTVLRGVAELPRSIVFWRAFLEWLGGFASLMTVLLVLAPSNIGGMPDRPLRSVEVGSRSARARIFGTTARILPIYTLTTLSCMLLLGLAGLPGFDAVCLSFSALSTGGFMPGVPSIEAYDSRFAEAVLCLFMLLGGTSIVWQRHVITMRWQVVKDYVEARAMVILVIAIAAIFAANLRYADGGIAGLSLFDSAWVGLLSSVSVITTTGFEIREGGYTALSLPLLIALSLIGGAGYSTAGGLKLYRLGAMMSQAQRELRRLLYPHGVNSMRYGATFYNLQLVKAVWVAFLCFVGALGLTAAALAGVGLSFEASLLAAVSALANVGGIYAGLGGSIEGWVPYHEMSQPMLTILTVAMIVGRMEVVAVLSFFNIYFWRS